MLFHAKQMFNSFDDNLRLSTNAIRRVGSNTVVIAHTKVQSPAGVSSYQFVIEQFLWAGQRIVTHRKE